MRTLSNWQSRKLPRRSVVRGAAISGGALAAAAVVGCGDDDSSTPSSGTTAGASPSVGAQTFDPNATIRAGVKADPSDLDPQSIGGAGGANNIATHFVGALARDPKTSEPKAYIADYQWIDGNKALQFKVRPGIKFHNGEPVNADQLKFNLDRVRGLADYNPKFLSSRKQVFAAAGEAKVMDELTLRLEMVRGDVSMPGNFVDVYLPLVPKGYVTGQGDTAVAAKAVGLGPFKFVSRTPDTEMRSERYDDFFYLRDQPLVPRLPYSRTLIQVVRPDDQARAAALEAGEIDVATDLTADSVKAFAGRKDFRTVSGRANLALMAMFPTRFDRDPTTGGPNPFRDIRVRKAFNMAVDVDAIIKNLLTGQESYAFGLGQSQLGFPEDIAKKRFPFDPRQAKALLAEAGYPNGFSFDFYASTDRYPTADVVIPAVAGYLRDVGLKANVKFAPVANHISQLLKQDTFGLWQLATGGVEPTPQFGALYYSKGQYAVSVYPELGIDALHEQQSAEFDLNQRKKLISEITTKWYENASWLFLHENVNSVITRNTIDWQLAGLSLGTPEYWNMKVRPA